MPIQIPKVPKFCEIPPKVPMFSKDDEREKEKDRRKGRLPGYFDLDKDDRESDYEKDRESDYERDRESDYESDRESDYERDRAYSEFISRLEDDEDGGEGGVKEEEKEKEKRKEKARPMVDLFTRMYFERVLFYFGKLTEEIVDRFLELIIYGNIVNPKKKTRLYIHSTKGEGSLKDTVRMYDLMQYASSGLDTVCVGITVSMATLILSGGNKREALDHSRIMLGKPKRIFPILKIKKKKKKKIDWKDASFVNQRRPKLRRILIEQLAKRTGKSEETVKNDLLCPKYMSVEEAQIHGIIDSVADEFIM